jgi:hypothetical protein
LLRLFVINPGIVFGAGLYEGRIVVPEWLSSTPEGARHWNADGARRDDTGRRFWMFVTTIPLTLLTVANLVAAWRASGPVRSWWLAAVVAALADRKRACTAIERSTLTRPAARMALPAWSSALPDVDSALVGHFVRPC